MWYFLIPAGIITLLALTKTVLGKLDSEEESIVQWIQSAMVMCGVGISTAFLWTLARFLIHEIGGLNTLALIAGIIVPSASIGAVIHGRTIISTVRSKLPKRTHRAISDGQANTRPIQRSISEIFD